MKSVYCAVRTDVLYKADYTYLVFVGRVAQSV